FADRVEIGVAHQALEAKVIRSTRRAHLEPRWLALAHVDDGKLHPRPQNPLIMPRRFDDRTNARARIGAHGGIVVAPAQCRRSLRRGSDERNADCFVVPAHRRAAARADDGVAGAGPWVGCGCEFRCWFRQRRAIEWLGCAEWWGIAEWWGVEWRRRTER